MKNMFYIRGFVGFIKGEIVAVWRRTKTTGEEVPLNLENVWKIWPKTGKWFGD